MPLKEYKQKRDFSRTKEPSGSLGRSKGKKKKFFVQLHDASHLHFDFRLEISGVLVSWAVPKGLPDPGEKRLAVMTENHPMAYGSFEGIIPDGNYGAGTVMVWDTGTYENKDPLDIKKGLENGKIHVTLSGKKLKGDYILVKFKDSGKNWLIMKPSGNKKEKRDDKSALTGRTMNEIAKEGRWTR